jgi:hypothetical protein
MRTKDEHIAVICHDSVNGPSGIEVCQFCRRIAWRLAIQF